MSLWKTSMNSSYFIIYFKHLSLWTVECVFPHLGIFFELRTTTGSISTWGVYLLSEVFTIETPCKLFPELLICVIFSCILWETRMKLYGVAWYGTARHGTARHGTARHGTVWYGMVWYGLAWYGVGWRGLAWYFMVWYGMVWHDMTICSCRKIVSVVCFPRLNN